MALFIANGEVKIGSGLVVRADHGFAVRVVELGTDDRVATTNRADSLVPRGREERAAHDAARCAAGFERRSADDEALTRDLERRTIPPSNPDRNLTP